jgi:hypothetical protein
MTTDEYKKAMEDHNTSIEDALEEITGYRHDSPENGVKNMEIGYLAALQRVTQDRPDTGAIINLVMIMCMSVLSGRDMPRILHAICALIGTKVTPDMEKFVRKEGLKLSMHADKRLRKLIPGEAMEMPSPTEGIAAIERHAGIAPGDGIHQMLGAYMMAVLRAQFGLQLM